MSDICHYYERNPDPVYPDCRVTGLHEDGVVFDALEPFDGLYTFIGRTALLDAMAEVYDQRPGDIDTMLTGGTKHMRAKIQKLEDEKALLTERLAKINEFLLDEGSNAAYAVIS